LYSQPAVDWSIGLFLIPEGHLGLLWTIQLVLIDCQFTATVDPLNTEGWIRVNVVNFRISPWSYFSSHASQTDASVDTGVPVPAFRLAFRATFSAIVGIDISIIIIFICFTLVDLE